MLKVGSFVRSANELRCFITGALLLTKGAIGAVLNFDAFDLLHVAFKQYKPPSSWRRNYFVLTVGHVPALSPLEVLAAIDELQDEQQ